MIAIGYFPVRVVDAIEEDINKSEAKTILIV